MIVNYQPLKISARQLSLILISTRIAVMTVFLPITWATKDPKDAWMSAILSGLGGVFITIIIVMLSKRHPHESLVEICKSLLGKWAGGILSAFFLLFFLNVTVIIVREFAEILNNAIMPETPIPIFIVYVMLAVILAVNLGLEAIIRTNAITLPISLLSLFLILVLLVKDYHPEALVPVLEEGWKPVIAGSLVPLALYGEIILLPMIYPYVRDQQKVLFYSILAEFVSMFYLVGLILAVVAVFGPEEAANLTLPVFSLVRMISIADFFERIESIMVAVWISLLYAKMCIYLYVGVIGTGQLFRLKNYKNLIIPFGSAVIILAYKSFNNLADLKYFTSKYWGYYAVLFEYVVPCFLLVLSFCRKGKKSHAG